MSGEGITVEPGFYSGRCAECSVMVTVVLLEAAVIQASKITNGAKYVLVEAFASRAQVQIVDSQGNRHSGQLQHEHQGDVDVRPESFQPFSESF